MKHLEPTKWRLWRDDDAKLQAWIDNQHELIQIKMLRKMDWTDSQMFRYQAVVRGIEARYDAVMARRAGGR